MSRATSSSSLLRGAFWGSLTVALLMAVLSACGQAAPTVPPPIPTPEPTGASTTPRFAPPEATPLTDPPAAPAGDGTTATITTELGNIVIELFNRSSPVAAENFANLAEARFYDGVVFHRVVPGFVIQGGDPTGTGRGSPGYAIRDDAVVGDYVRGTLAMARPSGPGNTLMPDSQGSQFFIILGDLRETLSKAGMYAIFGRVTEGMEVVDQIAAGATDPANDRPVDPVAMLSVAVQRP